MCWFQLFFYFNSIGERDGANNRSSYQERVNNVIVHNPFFACVSFNQIQRKLSPFSVLVTNQQHTILIPPHIHNSIKLKNFAPLSSSFFFELFVYFVLLFISMNEKQDHPTLCYIGPYVLDRNWVHTSNEGGFHPQFTALNSIEILRLSSCLSIAVASATPL